MSEAEGTEVFIEYADRGASKRILIGFLCSSCERVM